MKDWKEIARKADAGLLIKEQSSLAKVQRDEASKARSIEVLTLLWQACSSIVKEYNEHVASSALKLTLSEISYNNFLVVKKTPEYSLRFGVSGNNRIEVRIAKEFDFQGGANSYTVSEAGALLLNDGTRSFEPLDLAEDTCERFIRVGRV